ncbi:ComEC/Rec2 family competence protein [Pengzhenrongella sp.]|uniref:ComEC/Rec2 family competence protein n=1 Tax=Pengzhenrongella sp. TaxID=2888820 RepID=UPI002F94BE46
MRTSHADLRLAPAAITAWGTALVVVVLPVAAAVALGCAACAGAGLVGLWTVARRRTGPQSAGRPAVPAGRAEASSGPRAAAGRGAEPASRATGHVLLLLVVVAAVALAGAGQLRARGSGPLGALLDERATVRVVGTVRSEPQPVLNPAGSGGQQTRYRIELGVEQISGRARAGSAAAPVLVLGGPAWADVAYGSRVQATGRLAPAEPGEVAFALLAARGPPRQVDPPGVVDRVVRRIRHALLDASDRLDPDPRGLVPGIAVGDTTRMPPELTAAMKVSGLTHVTAVSGAHFAIIGAAVLGLTVLAGLSRPVRVGVVAAVMALFVLLVHPEPSVLRAAVMGAVGVGGLLLGRPSRAIPALAATVIALLVVDPWLARSYGFVLSVLATAGIVLLTEPLTRWLARGLPDLLAHAIAVPFAAQSACAPVIVLLNPALSPFAVPANLVAAPALVPATVAGVLAALVAPWWSWGGAMLAQVAGWSAWWIAEVARVCAGLPGAQLPWPGGAGGAVLLGAATVAAGVGIANRDLLRRRWLGGLLSASRPAGRRRTRRP